MMTSNLLGIALREKFFRCAVIKLKNYTNLCVTLSKIFNVISSVFKVSVTTLS